MPAAKTLATVVVVAVAALAVYMALGGGSGGAGGGEVRLIGSGSTFVKPAMDAWIEVFTARRPSVVIEYTGGGSGKGVSDILSGLVDFAASDPPLPRAKWERARGQILQFPVVLGAVVVVYNVPGLEGVQLNMSGEVLAKIYLGEIRYWDDPAIKALNPAVADKLPHREIIAVHRSDASGTTEIFTLFLSKSCRDWAERVGYGKTVEWPVDSTGRGVGGEGNQGVTEAVISNPYSIGYVEWAYALENNLPIARVENPAGKFVAPTRETVAAAFKVQNPPGPDGDWSSVARSFVYSSVSPDAYPIAGQTFLLVKTSYGSGKCEAMKEFIRFIAGEGQDMLPRGYAPLPDTLRSVALKAADMITCRG